MDNIKHVFVDFDGTLIDSLGALYQTYCDFLSTYGIKGTQEEFDELNGPTIAQCVQILKDRYGLQKSHENLLADYNNLIKKNYKMAKPFVDAEFFLSSLRENGLSITLVTSGAETEAREHLDRNNWNNYFSETVFGDEVEKSKPAPDIYLKALDKTKAAKSQVIVVEDSLNGVLAAQAAGLKVFSVGNAQTNANKKFECLADIWKDLKDDMVE